MADAATLIVLVAAGEAADATTRAMAKATREALGPAAHVVVRETTGEPGDADVAAVERAENPDAVVELSWIGVRESHHRQASVRVHLRTGRWVDRWITFRPTDADGERGRTVGFAIASILPEESPAGTNGAAPFSTSSTGSANGPTAPVLATPEAPGTTPGAPASGTTLPSGPASAPAPPAATAAPLPPPPPESIPPPVDRPPRAEPPNPSQEEHNPRLTADLLGVGFWDPPPGTKSVGYGVSGSAQYFIVPVLSARAGGSLRGGSIAVGNASLNFNVWSVFGGFVYSPIRPRLRERLGVSVRAAWVVDFANISQAGTPGGSANGPNPRSQEETNYGPELAVDGAVLIVPDVEAVFGAGAEYMLRASRITVLGENQDHASTWVQTRPFGEAGFRIRF
jgi:hypothetical protein